MSPTLAKIVELRRALRSAVSEAFDAAMAIDEPAGTSPSWEALCQRHGVSLISEAERGEVIAAQRPLFGAPFMEFRLVVESIVNATRPRARALWNITSSDHEVRTQGERLVRSLDRTEVELGTLYKGAVLPKAGGMFANAMSLVGNAPAQRARPAVSTLKCKNCGAPRMKTADFVCQFCDQSMVG
jgi:hypothetical protein